jgi:aminoglycoside phosphotransferase (APT) family kinase protein
VRCIDASAHRHTRYLPAALRHRCLQLVRDRWLGTTVPLVTTHGDYGLQHVFVRYPDPQITGIIDWEFMRMEDLPLVELLNLLVAVQMELSDGSHAEWLHHVLANLQTNGPDRQMISNYCQSMHLPAGSIQVVALIYLFRFLEAMNGHPVEKSQSVLDRLADTLNSTLNMTSLP